MTESWGPKEYAEYLRKQPFSVIISDLERTKDRENVVAGINEIADMLDELEQFKNGEKYNGLLNRIRYLQGLAIEHFNEWYRQRERGKRILKEAKELRTQVIMCIADRENMFWKLDAIEKEAKEWRDIAKRKHIPEKLDFMKKRKP